jgi:hypothetical protein
MEIYLCDGELLLFEDGTHVLLESPQRTNIGHPAVIVRL